MENVTLGEIVTWLGIVSALSLGFTNLLKPFKEIKTRVEKVESTQERDLARLNRMEQDIKLILQSEHAMLKHMSTGNATGEMAQVQKDLEKYIIDRGA